MEIARLEVSAQRHIDRKQDTMCSMERDPRKEKRNLVENSIVQQMVEVVEAVEALETHPSPVERVRKIHYLMTFPGDVVKADTKKDNLVRHWRQCVGTVP